MAIRRRTFLYLTLLTSLLVSCIAIHLPNQATDPPHKHKLTSTPSPGGTVAASGTKDRSEVVTYRLINSNTGKTCILMKTDAMVELKFKLHGLEEQADAYIPEKLLIDGHCKSEDISDLSLSWGDYTLLMTFEKTPGGERWFISKIELTVNPGLKELKGIQAHGNAIKLYHNTMLIPTPVGKACSCEEVEIDLQTDLADRPPPDFRGTLILRALQLQPFMYKSEDFEPSSTVECSAIRAHRSETAPLAVGTTFAIFVLMTISGYAIFRYFRVKNVQYNTME